MKVVCVSEKPQEQETSFFRGETAQALGVDPGGVHSMQC